MQDEVLKDIEARLRRYLKKEPGYGEPEYVNSGGSAAIYKVQSEHGTRAIKVYNPTFLAGDGAASERRRLTLQRNLIGHDCTNLIKIFAVEEGEGTAFIVMEFTEWPQLKEVLEDVPDSKIPQLVKKLVAAVTYLERLEIVHRDIKPENIHVSPEFDDLVLIDLGVARELERPFEDGDDSTDHGIKRPFISTAQYSSPEYLFRLDAPSPEMWRALSVYQVGAVVHDLINKRPLFQAEVDVGNRWVLARAVLGKTPSFPDARPERLSALKSIASRCLVKDMATRLSVVDWSDFDFEVNPDPLEMLKRRFENFGEVIGGQAAITRDAKLNFERSTYFKRLIDGVRSELIPICQTKAPLSISRCDHDGIHGFSCAFTLGSDVELRVRIEASWTYPMNDVIARISTSRTFYVQGELQEEDPQKIICDGAIGVTEEIVISDIARAVAAELLATMNVLEAGKSASALS
jgi:serine/threonine-protein kinase